MREVKEICERLLEAPAPPAPPATSSAELLGMARASVRRTRMLVTGGATAFLAFLTAVAIPLTASRTTAPAVIPSVSASPSQEPVFLRYKDPVLRQMMAALETMPPPQGLKILNYGAKISQQDGAAEPPTTYSVDISYTKDSLATAPPAHQFVGGIEVRRFHERRDPAFLRDPCRTDRMRELGLGPSSGCSVTDGIAIGNLERMPEVRFAIRHAGDWTILVRHSGNVFTDDRIRQIILDPAFAP